MTRKAKAETKLTPPYLLEQLVQRAMEVSRKARKHRQKLTSDNFYSNKFVELRAEGINAFRDLSTQSPGDVSAMAEMIEAIFSPNTDQKKRAQIAQELVVSLRTTWRNPTQPATDVGHDSIFPLAILTRTRRGYLMTIGRQMNGCFGADWYDGCAVMMRRILEIVIIEAFEHKGLSQKIKDKNGNYFYLSDLIGVALAEPCMTLSRNAKSVLPQLREIGNSSAHGRYFTAQKSDIERVRHGCRIVIEEFLHHAGLL
ncbi:MAG TPA: DUF4145 domain-containing protein [Nitrospiria bacterium]|jgi:hypothetical protein